MNSNGLSEHRDREYKDQSVSKRGTTPMPTEPSRHDAKSAKGSSHAHAQSASHDDALKYVLSSFPLDSANIFIANQRSNNLPSKNRNTNLLTKLH